MKYCLIQWCIKDAVNTSLRKFITSLNSSRLLNVSKKVSFLTTFLQRVHDVDTNGRTGTRSQLNAEIRTNLEPNGYGF